MLESITYHTFLEAIGINVIVALFLSPVAATVWDVSKARYIKERAAAAKDTQSINRWQAASWWPSSATLWWRPSSVARGGCEVPGGRAPSRRLLGT